MSVELFTVGHSNHTRQHFVELLLNAGVTAVADVRSRPFSRFVTQFNRTELTASLAEAGIKYVFLGRELGARPDDPSCYEHGQARYARIARTPAFRAGIERVLTGSKAFRIALMCAEKEPLECHRTLLVGRALRDAGAEVTHIHPDGSLEAFDKSMLRLLDLTGLPREDMFRTREELLAEAMRRQESRIAYVEEPPSDLESHGA